MRAEKRHAGPAAHDTAFHQRRDRPLPGAAARPAGPGGPGPGVPLSVWPGLPAPGAPAGQVIESFSRRGDLVAAGCPAAAGTAVAAGRAVATLLPGGCGARPLQPPSGLPPGAAPALAPGNPVTGQAALVVAGWYCPGPGDGGGDGPLYAACERLLRPGGVLAVTLPGLAAGGQAGAAVAGARAVGLVYAQHIVLLHAAIDGDRLDPGVPADTAAVPGVLVHSDLLVFTKPGGSRL